MPRQPRIQYKDCSEWQNSRKESPVIKKQQEYWLKEFSKKIPVLKIPIDFPRSSEFGSEGDFLKFQLKEEDSNNLKTLAVQENVTLYMLLFSVVGILLAKLSGSTDIVIGCPIVGRPHADLRKIIGMFVNTLAIRSYPENIKSFREYLKEVKKKIVEAFENQDYQFEDLVSELKIKRDAKVNPIFDVLFASQNFSSETKNNTLDRINFVPGGYDYEHKKAKFDLMILYMEREDHISFIFSYRTNLYKKDTIEKFIDYFKEIVSVIIVDPDRKIPDIEIISREKKNRLIEKMKNGEIESNEEMKNDRDKTGIIEAGFDF